MLSTRPDLLPPDAISEFSSLQDQVAPAPHKDIEAVLAEELSAPWSAQFAEFDSKPLAAASIAQVYRARLTSGEPVVVKVPRPSIREPIERGLDILISLARTVEARSPGSTLRMSPCWCEYFPRHAANWCAPAVCYELRFGWDGSSTVYC